MELPKAPCTLHEEIISEWVSEWGVIAHNINDEEIFCLNRRQMLLLRLGYGIGATACDITKRILETVGIGCEWNEKYVLVHKSDVDSAVNSILMASSLFEVAGREVKLMEVMLKAWSEYKFEQQGEV